MAQRVFRWRCPPFAGTSGRHSRASGVLHIESLRAEIRPTNPTGPQESRHSNRLKSYPWPGTVRECKRDRRVRDRVPITPTIHRGREWFSTQPRVGAVLRNRFTLYVRVGAVAAHENCAHRNACGPPTAVSGLRAAARLGQIQIPPFTNNLNKSNVYVNCAEINEIAFARSGQNVLDVAWCPGFHRLPIISPHHINRHVGVHLPNGRAMLSGRLAPECENVHHRTAAERWCSTISGRFVRPTMLTTLCPLSTPARLVSSLS